MPNFDTLSFNDIRTKNSSSICINGYYDISNKKCRCYDKYRYSRYYYSNSRLIVICNLGEKMEKFNINKNLRNLLSNDTDTLASKIISYDFSDYVCLILFIIAVVLVISYIRHLYVKWRQNKEDIKEEEENRISEQAKIDFEKKYLNSKIFSFIPISSPIKVKGNANSNIDTNDSSNEEKKKEKSKIINVSEFKIDNSLNLEMENFNSFCMSNKDEKINS